MRQWLNGWNGTGQSPGSAPAGPPGVPGTGDLDFDFDFDDDANVHDDDDDDDDNVMIPAERNLLVFSEAGLSLKEER